MPKRWCQCTSCQFCHTQAGTHGILFDADATKTTKCPGCHAANQQQRNARGNTTARGYGPDHQAARRQWEPVVNAGNAWCTETTCLEPDRHITPGTPWDLAHNEDRTGYKGPAHQRCNRATSKGR